MNILVPGFLLSLGGAHPAAVCRGQAHKAAGCAHCGHAQCKDMAGWVPGESLQLPSKGEDAQAHFCFLFCGGSVLKPSK